MADQPSKPASYGLGLPRYSRWLPGVFYPGLENALGRNPYRISTFPVEADDGYWTVAPEEEYRLDLISFRVYGTYRLWWVLALVNKINNPFVKPDIGEVIRCPALERINAVQNRI
jgi:hypothetical protein